MLMEEVGMSIGAQSALDSDRIRLKDVATTDVSCGSSSETAKQHHRLLLIAKLYVYSEAIEYGLFDLPHWAYRPYRLELDVSEDLFLINAIADAWGNDEPVPLRWVVQWLDKNPRIAQLNAGIEEKTGTYTSHTSDEVASWQRDYAGREVIWSDVAGLVGEIRDEHEIKYACRKCGGMLVALSVVRHKGNLRTRCVRCGERRTFYAKKPA